MPGAIAAQSPISTGSVAPYYNGTHANLSTSSNGSIRPVADFIAQDIYTERKQEFVVALSKLLPTAASTTKISPLILFLNTPLEALGGLEKVKPALYKPQGYFSRFFGKESWKDWSEDRTDLGYVVSNMAGILSTGPGRSVEEFVATLDPQRLTNANQQAEGFLKQLGPVAVSAKPQQPASELTALVRGRRDTLAVRKVGNEFTVNNYTTGAQRSPSIAHLSTSQFVPVVWEGEGVGDDRGIYCQVLNTSGNKIGNAFRVNGYTTGSQDAPRVAQLTNGRLVVVWSGEGNGDALGIFGRIIDTTGTTSTLGTEFRINVPNNIYQGVSYQLSPRIIRMTDSRFLVVWTSECQDDCSDERGDNYGVYGRLFDVSASSVNSGAEFPINFYTLRDQFKSSISPLDDTRFVATWISDKREPSTSAAVSYGVYARVFDTKTNTASAEFKISYSSAASVLALNDSQFVVVSSNGYGQMFHTSGIKVGDPFYVAAGLDFSLAKLSATRFMVTGTDFGQVSGQVFDTSGGTPQKVGAKFEPDLLATFGLFQCPVVTGLSSSRFMFAWESHSGRDWSGDIQGQVFEVYSNQPPTIIAPIANQTINAGAAQPLTLPLAATDPNGEVLDYSVKLANGLKVPDWIKLNATNLVIQPPLSALPQYDVVVSATDRINPPVPTTFKLTVRHAPTLTGKTISAQSVRVGKTLTVPFSDVFADADGDDLLYTVKVNGLDAPGWIRLYAANKTLVIQPPKSAQTNYAIVLTATDTSNLSVSTPPFALTILANNPPRVQTPISNQSAIVGQRKSISYAGVFEDRDGDPLNYTLSVDGQNQGWARLNTPLQAIEIDTIDQANAGNHTLNLTATDGIDSASTIFNLALKKNQPVVAVKPFIQKILPYTTPYPIDVRALFSDADGDSLLIETPTQDADGSAIPSPLMYYDENSKRLEINPSADESFAGEYAIRFQASDLLHPNEPAKVILLLTITPPPPPPPPQSYFEEKKESILGGSVTGVLLISRIALAFYRRNKIFHGAKDINTVWLDAEDQLASLRPNPVDQVALKGEVIAKNSELLAMLNAIETQQAVDEAALNEVERISQQLCANASLYFGRRENEERYSDLVKVEQIITSVVESLSRSLLGQRDDFLANKSLIFSQILRDILMQFLIAETRLRSTDQYRLHQVTVRNLFAKLTTGELHVPDKYPSAGAIKTALALAKQSLLCLPDSETWYMTFWNRFTTNPTKLLISIIMFWPNAPQSWFLNYVKMSLLSELAKTDLTVLKRIQAYAQASTNWVFQCATGELLKGIHSGSENPQIKEQVLSILAQHARLNETSFFLKGKRRGWVKEALAPPAVAAAVTPAAVTPVATSPASSRSTTPSSTDSQGNSRGTSLTMITNRTTTEA